MTSAAKKEFSDFGKEQRKTGGGPATKKTSVATAKVIEIFKETASSQTQVKFLLHHCELKSSYNVSLIALFILFSFL